MDYEKMTYCELRSYVEEKTKSYPCKSAYYATSEYAEIFPILRRKDKEEGWYEKRNQKTANKKRLNKAIKQGTLESGVPVGLFM